MKYPKTVYGVLCMLALLTSFGCRIFKPAKNNGILNANRLQKKKLDKIANTNQGMAQRLALTHRQVALMEQEALNYINIHPNSVWASFDTITRQLRKRYQYLVVSQDSLKQQYQKLSKQLKQGFVVNTQRLERRTSSMNEMVNVYVTQVKTNYTTYLEQEDFTQETTLPTDIFFEPGGFKVTLKRDPDELRELVAKMRKLRQNARFDGYRDQDISLIIKITGYTDGSPIKASRAKVANACNIPPASSQDELSRCLSRLRAEAIYQAIARHFPNYKIIKTIVGKGNLLARGDTSNNLKLRKVDVSLFMTVNKTRR